MDGIYVGVDIGGMHNTWFAAISVRENRPTLLGGPRKNTLQEIVKFCNENQHSNIYVAIDSQLSASIKYEDGFRPADRNLRSELSNRFENWVASFNSLSAVPIRGRLLAEELSKIHSVTVLETHPRVSLYRRFKDHPELLDALRKYKKHKDRQTLSNNLWCAWQKEWPVVSKIHLETVAGDGALDSIVCATVAYLFAQKKGDDLLTTEDKRWPFYVPKAC